MDRWLDLPDVPWAIAMLWWLITPVCYPHSLISIGLRDWDVDHHAWHGPHKEDISSLFDVRRSMFAVRYSTFDDRTSNSEHRTANIDGTSNTDHRKSKIERQCLICVRERIGKFCSEFACLGALRLLKFTVRKSLLFSSKAVLFISFFSFYWKTAVNMLDNWRTTIDKQRSDKNIEMREFLV